MQPQAYNRNVDFTERDPDDVDLSGINSELDAVALTANQLRDNLALIQNDEGGLRAGIVTSDTVSQTFLDEITLIVAGGITEDAAAAQAAAVSALAAANVAVAARDTAVAAATAAENSNTAAGINAATATAAAAAALASANAASTSQGAAAGSATAAAASAAAALASKNAAATSEANAGNSATAAAASAAAALASKNAAAISETSAGNSATAAAGSATSAANSAAMINTTNFTGQTGGVTGAATLAKGTTAQRPANADGLLRYNTTTHAFEGNADGAWGDIGGGARGAIGNKVFYENDQQVTGDYSVTAGKNAMSAGDITINNGITVTVPLGSNWSIV